MRKIVSAAIASALPLILLAQKPEDNTKSTGFPEFPQITNNIIPGAPLLDQPMLITGSQQEIRTEKHGLAYPAFYDWNHDGKTDLLLGEFETGEKGSYVKVYLNEGSDKHPKYSGKYFYATDIKGDTMTAHQWCCIGIHPRFVDLDNDGYVDMLSGQYNPGLINWWRGGKKGFEPRQFVDQEGLAKDPHDNNGMGSSELDPRDTRYWNYTSAGFADFNGDGLADLFVGGFGELKVALNIGTKHAPKFGLRKFLLGLDGLPLSVVKPGEKEIEKAKRNYKLPHYSGVYKSFITPVDWDEDGVLDLLVTHLYDRRETKDPVVFFRGVQTDKGLRFEDAKPLFTAADAEKTFPGCQPNIAVTDYNHDGVPDLVIGLSLPTINGFNIDSLVSWSYLHDLKLESPGKDAGRAIEWAGSLEAVKKKVDADPGMKGFYLGKLNDYKYLTLRHRGYFYVMTGKKNPERAIARKGVLAAEEIKEPVNETFKTGGGKGPVSYEAKTVALIQPVQEAKIEVNLHFKEGWYGYADTEGNIAAGWIPTKVEYTLPKGFELIGDPIIPPSHPKGATEVFNGDDVKFMQKFRVAFSSNGKSLPYGEYVIGVMIQYQTCNEEMCLPPVTEKIDMKVNYRSF
ncbi:FG-GAP repeat domain-containing protein [Chitinophaga tropicalis]|uniref:Thiol:disulfide interchange protein DsbD N-terminal domain-containing protein n=1 Tax=Chitinophaga tropicalis TaxID=2683588 RepID=A0A7K1U366_9BACT|nr:protein-disulfide reductase DsbD domain-containing protein [Chitinophaga tropicalis]MVT08803.1 hypothetical protein [Chitinophaga tropicalis]